METEFFDPPLKIIYFIAQIKLNLVDVIWSRGWIIPVAVEINSTSKVTQLVQCEAAGFWNRGSFGPGRIWEFLYHAINHHTLEQPSLYFHSWYQFSKVVLIALRLPFKLSWLKIW